MSTAGFAIMARTLGPSPFAVFATALFVFTLTSLLLDLSPGGYLLVHGDSQSARRVTWFAAVLSSLITGVCVALMIPIAVHALLDIEFGLLDTGLMTMAVMLQFYGQVPRSRLIIAKRYGASALADVLATAISVASAVVASLARPTVTPLALQLCLLASVQTAALQMAATRIPKTGDGVGGPPTLKSAITYGLRVLPVNVSTYLSRSLDTGFLPAILPAASAGAYARSYQLAVVPIRQVQLSLGSAIVERMARANSESELSELRGMIWRPLILIAASAGALIAGLSSILAGVLFGPGWPQANVMIAGMACVIPGMAVTILATWILQLRPSMPRSLRHLGVLLLTPAAVLTSAAIAGTQGAMVALTLTGATGPALTIAVNRNLFGDRRARRCMCLASLAAWAVVALEFTIVATASRFWGFTAWRD